MQRDLMFEIFSTIVFYNGYVNTIKEWVKGLKAYDCMFEGVSTDEWYTEKHALWEMLVVAFGSWGISIRSGFIEETAECIKFLEKVIEDVEE